MTKQTASLRKRRLGIARLSRMARCFPREGAEKLKPRMTCKFHVSAKLIATRQRIPFRTLNGDIVAERIQLRCPEIEDVETGRRCRFVAIQEEPERVDRRICSGCGKTIPGSEDFSGHQCLKCRRKQPWYSSRTRNSQH